jgi:diguanylate cyclase (GGDEF)-like protein
MKNKKMLIKFEYKFFFSVIILTGIVLLAQYVAGISTFIWCSIKLIVILMFITLQQRELYRDALTGARNRLVLKKCLDAYSKKPVKNLSVIMIDLDHFKNINDAYGHSEGDLALITFVKVLQKVFSEHGIVIRMGGDEFLILVHHISTSQTKDLLKKLTKMIDSINNKGIKPYQIRYSCACGTYTNTKISIDEFIHEIDLEMYENKKDRKNQIYSVENFSF